MNILHDVDGSGFPAVAAASELREPSTAASHS